MRVKIGCAAAMAREVGHHAGDGETFTAARDRCSLRRTLIPIVRAS
jgi:hypothetical protein